MKSLAKMAIALATASVLTLAPAVSATAATKAYSPSSYELKSLRSSLLNEVNKERAKGGLKALKAHGSIDTVAQNCSKSQATNAKMAHCTGFQNKYPSGWSSAGENVAAGYKPADVVAAWMKSPGHKANIMNPKYTHLGTGVYYSAKGAYYYTQNFAQYTGITAAPTPKVTGTPQVGNTLGSSIGVWSGASKLTYQWYANGSPIKGATTSKLKVTSSMVGKKLRLQVTGTRGTFSKITKISGYTGAAFLPKLEAGAAPKISGSALAGATLSASTGTWISGVKFKYTWYAGSKKLKTTTSKLKLPASLAGQSIKVTVTAYKSGYSNGYASSSYTGKVAVKKLSASTPKVSGTAKAGKTLTAKVGSWTSGAKLSYTWYADGKKIGGGNKKTQKVFNSFKGKAITVKVTGTKSGYSSLTKQASSVKVAR